MTIADEIRLATSQNRLHPLVAKRWASPQGICNCAKVVGGHGEEALVFCRRDFGHEDAHNNGPYYWTASWPLPETESNVRKVIEAIQSGRTDDLDVRFICANCGARVYFQREPGPCPQCGKARPVEGTSDVS